MLLITALCTVLSTQSCKNECDDVICQNGGTCVDGTCDCPGGYLGSTCENFDPAQVQALLANHTPIDLVRGGVPLDSLYGKMYEGGLIFYLNTDDGTGMVAATEDQGNGVAWGCQGTDIMGLNNVQGAPAIPETEEGARIGDGKRNTDAILDECITGSAAKLCRDLGEDWFLPSRGELNLMSANLSNSGHDGPGPFEYWSSTEIDLDNVWIHFISTEGQGDFRKSNNARVRAAKVF